ncbi:Ig-like domain-containing protein [Pectobacterium brasiliense]|uniref:Ig-like domain-containing protein n=2 Tax=Pectobacterium brasiliense TaxID=180957 RepID=UPI001CE1468E|nr:Ig-like domain-containing protein [Pectobacterium brasiliense]MCA5917993.1 Ig-like domain-containing protein [Pectobacterium brasiliense]MCA5933856.1 Ig-like domain-containing protein [Pectobacterium brasiliense]MCA5938039.1 Ig-like domain-containing protein [Pectobacterium brasiliense]UCP90872.1 Ig-like domain-containing protein [Pectobacterium brasiliense]
MSDMNVIAGNANILSRHSGQFINTVPQGTTNVKLLESSTVRIFGTPDVVSRYERVGNDLILHMKDGTTVRYESFFTLDAAGYHSELVFDDGARLIHAQFSGAAAAEGTTLAAEAVAITPEYTALGDMTSLLIGSTTTSALSATTLGSVLGAVAVGGAAAAGVAVAVSSSSNDNTTTPPPQPEPLTVDAFAGNNGLNRTEIGQPHVLSGKTTGVSAGQTVTITLNDVVYTTTIAADGSWQFTLPADAFTGLQDGVYALKVSVPGANGVIHEKTIDLTIDTLPPNLTVDKFTGDNYLTVGELANGQILNGTGEVGQNVSITLNGKTYTTTINAAGTWTLTVPAADLRTLSEGEHAMSFTISDIAGNVTVVNRTIIVDTTPPELSLSPFTGNNLITADELQSSQFVSGTASLSDVGQTVTVTLNGITYTTTVESDGAWNVFIPSGDIQALTNGTYDLVASLTDKAGNTTTLPPQTITVDTNAEAVNISIISFDNRLNAVEAGQPLTIDGTTANVAAGQTVTVTLNGKPYTTTTGADGKWSLDIPSADLLLLSDGSNTLTASVQGISGDIVTVDHTLDVHINTLPSITLTPPFADGVLNGAEAAQDQVIRGETGISGRGQTVSLTIGGNYVTGTVDANGNWTVTIPKDVLQSLPSDNISVLEIVVRDIAGNETIVTQDITVDTTPPTLTVSAIAQDDVLNGAELAVDQVINGTASLSEAGRTVTVTLNDKPYTTTVGNDGNWSITLPTADLVAIADGNQNLTVTLTDAAGNTTTVTRPLTIDSGATTAPTITINNVADDNVIDGAEAKVSQQLSGTTTNVEAGQVVTISLNGKTYLATVQSGGVWSINVSTADIALLADGAHSISVNVSNKAGNTASGSQNINVDKSGDSIAINIIASDNLLSRAESLQPLAISGNTANVPAGQTVTVTLNGKNYTTTVAADGSWTLQIPSADLQLLSDGNATVTASVNVAGSGAITDNHTLGVHIHTLPQPTIDTPFGNGSLNGTEALVSQTITGHTGISGAGQTVILSLGGKSYTGTVDTAGHWKVTVPAADLQQLPEGNNTLLVNAQDAAGNQASHSFVSHTDFTAPTLTIGTIAGDDTINLVESQSNQTVNGTASISEAGRTVVITFDGQFYTGVVGTDGNWSINLPTAALRGMADGSYKLSASLTDAVGNTVSVEKSIELSADPAFQPKIFVNAFVDENNVINAADLRVSQLLTGSSSNVETGQVATILLNKKFYFATIQSGGNWSVEIPAEHMAELSEGTVSISAQIADLAGNTGNHEIWSSIDTSNDSISISIVALDNQINRLEASQPLTISGSTVNVTPGESVTVTLNGKTYTGTIAANGSWSVTIESSDMLALPDGTATITASVANPGDIPVTASRDIDIHINNLPQPTIDQPFGDGILNIIESASGQNLTGKTGITGGGQSLIVTLNGKTYAATVDNQGNWSAALPAADLQSLPSGVQTIHVEATDIAGNSIESTREVTVDTVSPILTLKPLTNDGIINAAESLNDQTISGNALQSEAGRTVLVTVNNKNYQAQIQVDGSWSTTIPAADLQAMADGNYTVTATLTGASGNSTTSTESLTLDANPANLPLLTVNAIALNNIIDGGEINVAQIISGGSLNVEAGQRVTVTLGDNTYTATVDGNGQWRVSVPSVDLLHLAQGTHTVTIGVNDVSGNPATLSQTITVNTSLSGIAIDTVAGDDKLNQAEAAQDLTINGSSQNVTAGTTVTIMLNGKSYDGVVQPNGTWSITVSAADVSALTDGTSTLTVTTIDSTGNVLSGSHTIDVFTHSSPSLTLNTPFSDGILNAAEAGVTQTLSGTTGIASPGQTVTATLGGVTYTGIVDTAGNWTISLPANGLQNLPNGTTALQVSVSDAAGNSSTLTSNVTVARTPPTLSAASFATDNILNSTEVQSDQLLTGTASPSSAGQTITTTLNGKTYSGTIGSDGTWSITIPSADLSNLSDGNYSVVTRLTDAAGNTTTTTQTIVVDASPLNAPIVTIGTFAGNNIIDGAEVRVSQVLSGTSKNVEQGQTVTISFNGKPYTAQVLSNGSWSTTISDADMALLANGSQTITVSVSDIAGNTATSSSSVTVNTNASGLSIAPITGDNQLNALEATNGITINGGAVNVAPGTDVNVILNGKTYTVQVQSDGTWSATIQSGDLQVLGDGIITVNVTAVDQAGNALSGTQQLGVSIHNPPVASLHMPFSNGYLNLSDAQAGQTLYGTTGLRGAGQTVSVTIGSTVYNGTVDNNGNWNLQLPPSVLTTLADGLLNISVTVSDAAGNTSTVQGSALVDLTPPVLTINPIGIDDIINIAESLLPMEISGTSPVNDSGRPIIVNVTINGQIYQGLAQADGTWSVTVPAGDLQNMPNGITAITATLTDAAGNTGTVSHSITLDTDPAQAPTLTIATLSTDDYLNLAESGQPLIISGSSQNVEQGQQVTITLNGGIYFATVGADGSWSVQVPATDVGTIPDGKQTVSASVTDVSGNPGSATHSITVITDATNLPAITITTLSGNDVISAQDTQSDLLISGSTTNVQVGQRVTVMLNSKTYLATVGADGSWSTTVPASDVQNLPQGNQDVTATVSDIAQNPATATHPFTVDTLPPLLSIDMLVDTSDIGLADALAGLPLSGKAEAGLLVTIKVGTAVYSVVADSNGIWQIAIAANDLLALGDGVKTLEASVTDGAGNASATSIDITLKTQSLPTLTLDSLYDNNVLTVAELATATTIGGSYTNLPVGTTIQVTIGTYTTTGVTLAGGLWSATIPANALSILADGNMQVSATVTDSAGNTGSASGTLDVVINTNFAVSIATPFVDGVLNQAESTVDQLLTGTTGFIDPNQSVSVSVTNGTITTTYNATVAANGQWSVTLPAADLAALGDGTHTINVTVTDHAGNTGSGSGTFTSVIVGVPVASLDTPFGDGKLSLADAQPGVTLSGQTGLTSNVGQTVSVSINGTSLPATVNADGSWSLSLDRQTLIDLPDGTVNFTVIVTDTAGNTSTTAATANVLTTTLPVATLDLPFGDGVLNTTEIQAIQTLTGKTGITSAGQEVIVTVTNKTTQAETTFTAVADGLGGWSRELSPADLAIFTEGNYSISVKVTDWVGNTNTSASLDVSSAQTLPAPLIDVVPFGLDNILSSAEAASALTFSGRTQVSGSGQGVKLEIDLNGIRYTATVDNAGNWSVTLPPNALNSLVDGQHTITVTAVDAAGNVGSAPIAFTSDFTPPAITLNTPFDDGYLNIAEAATLAGRTLSGSAGDAASMTVTLGGQPLVVQLSGGIWTATLTPTQLSQLADGTHTISITATDSLGNSATLNSQAILAVQAAPTVSITTFAGLDGLNYAESRATQAVSGTSTGLEVGQNVTVRLNGVDYTTKVLTGGTWSVNIPPSALQVLPNTSHTLSVSAQDKAGNPTDPSSVNFNVNLTPPPTVMTIDPISTDNIINASEIGGNITISGRSIGPASSMTAVQISVNGVLLQPNPITDINGNWSITIPALPTFSSQGEVFITATSLDATLTTIVTVDTIAPTLDIVSFASDNVLNATEASTEQAITGSASVADAGQIVSISLNGKTYTAQVSVTGDWSVNVPAADLALLADGSHTITATLTDKAGNTTTDTQVVTVDTDIPLLSVTLFDNNILTLAEALAGAAITGRGEVGATVTLTAGPLTGTTTVGLDGNWSIPILSADLQSLTDGAQVIGVTLTDTAGNTAHLDATLDVALNQTLGAGINDIFGNDGILNLAESLVTQVISGNATGNYLGAKVQVTVLGTMVEGTVGANGAWSIALPPNLFTSLSNGLLAVNVDIIDSQGNVKNQLVNIDVLKSLPVINSVVAFTDGALNAADVATSQIISGVVSNVNIAAGATVAVTLGTKVYTGITVGAGGAWSLSVPALDLQALQDGTLALGVAVTDHAGNTASQVINVPTVIKNLPSITLNPVFGDSVLNLADLLVNQTLSGTATGLAGGTITLSIAGSQVATATVGTDGKWSAAVTPSVLGILQGLGNGDFTVTATATDSVGNSASGTAGIKFDFAQPVITLNPVFGGDGFINAAEALVAQTISGVVTNASAGSQVAVTLGGKTFLSTVGAGGAFSLTLLPSDLGTLLDGNTTLNVSVTNTSGNIGTVNNAINIIAKTLPTISLGSLFGGDGFLNAAEAALTQTISGTTTNAVAGSSVVIRIGTLTLNATVGSDGTWSTSITPLQLSGLANGNLTVSATVTDPAGNSTGVSTGLNIAILPPTITLNPLFNNGVLDLPSLLSTQLIGGTTANVPAGTAINVTLGSKTYTTTVGANGSWSLPVPSLDLKALVDGVTNVGVRLVDAAGNVGTQTGTVSVAINGQPTLTINPLFGGDGLLNAVEAAAGQLISGTSTNAIGSTIQISLGTKTYSAVVQSNGSWSVSLPSLDLNNLTDGTLSLSASLTNAAGKSISAGASIGVGVHTLPTVNLGSLFGGDGYLNLAEAGINQIISGTTTNAAGGSVTLTVGGLVLNAAVASNGTWSISVPSANLLNIADGNLSVGVKVTDRYGNTNNASSNVIVKTHQLPQLGIDAVGSLIGNTVGLLANGITVSGTSRYVQQGAKVTVTLLGQTLQGTVGADGKWSAHFTSSLLGINILNVGTILTALLGTAVEASVTDQAGNFTGVSAGLTSGISLGLPLMSMMALDVDDSSLAQVATLSSEPLDTGETAEVQPLHVSSKVATAALSETNTIDNSASTEVEDSVYAIGGVVINLADGSVQTGEDVEGGEGDDLITLSTLDFTQIDGGNGIDTLVLDGIDLNLDLTALGLKIDNVEIFDLGQNGTNSITLDLDRALNVTDRPEDDLLIVGGEGNQVHLIPGEGVWSTVGQRDIEGQRFDVYHHSSLDNANNLGDVLVQQGLLVNMV